MKTESHTSEWKGRLRCQNQKLNRVKTASEEFCNQAKHNERLMEYTYTHIQIFTVTDGIVTRGIYWSFAERKSDYCKRARQELTSMFLTIVR